MLEPLDEDLLLISRIKGLRSKNAHVQAQTSKMRELLADWQEHQERESEQRLQRRRRTVKVLEKFLRSQKLAFAAWRRYIQKQKRQLQQEEQQTALQDLRESKQLQLVVIYSWRCSMLKAYKERLARLVDERDEASAKASKAHQVHQLQLNSIRLRLLKERRSHQLADTRATLAGLQVLGAHLPFGVAPCATTSELTALTFCAWHLHTAMMSGRDPWGHGKATLRLSVGTSARGKSHVERSGAKALQLSCRIARRMALQCLAAWREFRVMQPASQRARSSRLKESPNAKVKKSAPDAKELRWLLLQAFLNWRCVSVTLLCERRVRQEAKAAASECAALQLQVDHWRHQCKEASQRPVTTPSVVTPSHVLLAWRFVSLERQVFTATREIAEPRNSRHADSVVDRAECERDLKCSGKALTPDAKETAVLRLIFLALQMNAQAYRAEREGFRQSSGRPSPKILIGPKMGAPDLKEVFLAWRSQWRSQEHRSREEMCNAKETWDSCLLWMSFHAFRMAVSCGESSMAHQSGLCASAQGGFSTSSAPLCSELGPFCGTEQMEQSEQSEQREVPPSTLCDAVKDLEPHLSRVTAAGPTPGDKAKCAAANPAGPLPPAATKGTPRRDPVEKMQQPVFDANLSVSPVDSPGSGSGWTSSMSIVEQSMSGPRGSPSALSPAMCWPDQLDFPCSARIVEKPCR